MFSKEWLEQCSQSITTYETPANDDTKSEESETENEKEMKKSKSGLDIKKMLYRMRKRRGEE